MSPKFSLDYKDMEKWAMNTIVFLAPALVIFITAIQSGSTLNDAGYVLLLWVVNTVVDLSKKYVQGITQPPVIDTTNPLN